jgi:hypothetical protein
MDHSFAAFLPASAQAALWERGIAEPRPPGKDPNANPELREAFRDFVAQTLLSQMLRTMRHSLGKPPYFHGGKMEEVFQSELDRLLVEKSAEKIGHQFADSMFELFALRIR